MRLRAPRAAALPHDLATGRAGGLQEVALSATDQGVCAQPATSAAAVPHHTEQVAAAAGVGGGETFAVLFLLPLLLQLQLLLLLLRANETFCLSAK